MATRDILDYQGNIIGQLSLSDESSENEWNEKLAMYAASPIEPTIEEIIKLKIAASEDFGLALMNQFVIENVLMGITQYGKTIAVTDYLHKLSHYIMTGSLYAAIQQINVIIADESELKISLIPFITNNRMILYKNKIEDYLQIPRT